MCVREMGEDSDQMKTAVHSLSHTIITPKHAQAHTFTGTYVHIQLALVDREELSCAGVHPCSCAAVTVAQLILLQLTCVCVLLMVLLLCVLMMSLCVDDGGVVCW